LIAISLMITQEFLFTMSKYISGIANRNNVDDWSARASANSFHNSDTNRTSENSDMRPQGGT